MALSFPASPAVGQEYEFNGKRWRFNGAAWDAAPQATPDATIGDVQGLSEALALLAPKDYVDGKAGPIGSLTTVHKDNLVAAINEVNAKPSGGAGRTLLPTNFAFNELKANGTFCGTSNSADGPESGSGAPFYLVDVVVYPTGTANGDLIMHIVRTNNGGHYTRYGFIGLNAWDAWNSANIGTSASGQLMATVTDFNALTAVGLYRFTNASIANPPSADSTFLARVSKYANAAIVLQEVWVPGTAYAWIRTRSSGIWSAWKSNGVSPYKAVSNYTVTSADEGSMLRLFSGAITMPAVASVSTGFTVRFVSVGSTAVTINAATGQTINGYSSIRVYPGESVELICTGAIDWKTIGRATVVKVAETSSASGVATIAITAGFDDPEFSSIELRVEGLWGTQPSNVGMTFRDGAGDVVSATYNSARNGFGYNSNRQDGANLNVDKFYLSPQISMTGGLQWGAFKVVIPVNGAGQAAYTCEGAINAQQNQGIQPVTFSSAGNSSLDSSLIRGITLKMIQGGISNLGRLCSYGYRK